MRSKTVRHNRSAAPLIPKPLQHSASGTRWPRHALHTCSRLLLTFQGDGDYEGAGRLLGERGVVGPELQAELDRLAEADIPVDIVFEQGMSVLTNN